jgi:hypothetical protein
MVSDVRTCLKLSFMCRAINWTVRPFVHNERYKTAPKSRGIIRTVRRTCGNTEPLCYTSNINDLIQSSFYKTAAA